MNESETSKMATVATEAAAGAPTAPTVDAGKATSKAKAKAPKAAATPKAKKAAPAKRAAKKRASAPKAAKAAKPKRVKAPKEDLVVFACRVAEKERDAFHEASGPARASRFARRLMVVFAKGDESGFRALLKEAREARG